MSNLSRFTARRPLLWLAAAALLAGATACGGDSDSSESGANPATPTTPTPPGTPTTPATPNATKLFGTAVTSAPIKGGQVQVQCDGSTAVLSAVTSATGAWQVDTTGQTLPCAVRVSGGDLPAGLAYHSLAWSYDSINISPLTELMVANAVGKVPAAWWGSTGPADLKGLSQSAMDKALAALRAALGVSGLNEVDPSTVVSQDKLLEALQALQLALTQTGIDFSGLISSAASGAFVLPDNLRVALANNYAAVTGGGGGGGGVGPVVPGSGGNYTLTLTYTASGVSGPAITIENIPKPSSQDEFCGWVNDPSSNLSLSQVSNGAAGSLTINSCSFSGNVGQVSATIAITAPIAMTVPYSVTYTYR